jgi:phosphoribosylformylglycinamidine cyclo-ligase
MATNRASDARTTYEGSGVASLDRRPGFKSLLGQLKQTFAFRTQTGKSLLDFGYYACILDIGTPQAIAISTDGIGTKGIIAQMLDKYDTVGIDCVAMNANDVLCVGAEPIAMLDYIAVERADDRLLEEIGKGLLEGARQANISIPGGEISQIREIIRSERPGYGFDLVGTCVGLVDKESIIAGAAVAPGDVIVGLASSGIHSNGLTLARDVLLQRAGLGLNQHVPEFGRSVGEELLEPTRIYVRAVMPMLREGLKISALCHMTSEGFLNLSRVSAAVGFEIEYLPEAPAVFDLVKSAGPVDDEEMFRVYNMGVGFCVVCAPESAERVRLLASEAGCESWVLGRCVDDPEKTVRIGPKSLVGRDGRFKRQQPSRS